MIETSKLPLDPVDEVEPIPVDFEADEDDQQPEELSPPEEPTFNLASAAVPNAPNLDDPSAAIVQDFYIRNPSFKLIARLPGPDILPCQHPLQGRQRITHPEVLKIGAPTDW
jgi:hypothetical protein